MAIAATHFATPPWDLDASRFHLLTGKPRKEEPKPLSRTRPSGPAQWTPKKPKRDYALLRSPRPSDEPPVPWWVIGLCYAVPIIAVFALVAVLELARG